MDSKDKVNRLREYRNGHQNAYRAEILRCGAGFDCMKIRSDCRSGWGEIIYLHR